jgi:uncharacterized repeat protein (TIGR03803 family)
MNTATQLWYFALVFGVTSVLACQTSAQTLRTLHTFTAARGQTRGQTGIRGVNSDGLNPSGLIVSENILYGTTEAGGSHGNGVVFKLTTEGKEFVTLHSFHGSDGASPVGALTLASNILYGTTRVGGDSSTGTVFAVGIDGMHFRTMHHFAGHDGWDPYAGVILVTNTLYGTTYLGGKGYGTVFAVNVDGTGFTTLHVFTGGSDGGKPVSKLVLSGTTLYGTTEQGGFDGGGIGTVFKIDLDGTGFANLHSFALPKGNYPNWTNLDGIYLPTGVVLSGSTLYGVASTGGHWSTCCWIWSGCAGGREQTWPGFCKSRQLLSGRKQAQKVNLT